MLSFVRAFAIVFSACLATFALTCGPSSWSALSISRCEYQTARFFIPAKSAIAVR